MSTAASGSRATAIECEPGDLHGVALRGSHLIDGGDRRIEVLESGSGQRTLGRRVAELAAQMCDDGVLARARPGERRMAALGGDERRDAPVAKQRGHAEAGAGPDHGHRLTGDGLAAGERPDVVGAQMGECAGDRLEVVDDLGRREAECGAKLVFVGDPTAVGHEAASLGHRACHAENRARDRARLLIEERGDRALDRGVAGNRGVFDRTEAIAVEDRQACARAADVCEQCAVHCMDRR